MNNTDKQPDPFCGLKPEKLYIDESGLIAALGSNERYEAQFLGAGGTANEDI